MARYKVLKSIAHNFAHSFVSLMNYWDDDYVMCHLLKAVRRTRHSTLTVDVLKCSWAPRDLATGPIAKSLEAYCRDFGRFVTHGGAALDMVSKAKLRVSVQLGHAAGLLAHDPLNARIDARMHIRDDRGRLHTGVVIEHWGCESGL